MDRNRPAAEQERVVYEFFSPFAHVEGRYEVCRIRSPTHGVFDCFIVLDPEGPTRPATVYVDTPTGEGFMIDRYPQCTTIRVGEGALLVSERDQGRTVEGVLRADDGPVRRAELTFAAAPTTKPRDVPYGGGDQPVWGNPELTCFGVDLVLDGAVHGEVEHADGTVERFAGEPATVTLGSFGRIAPRGAAGTEEALTKAA